MELLHQIDRGLGLAIGLPDAVAHPANRDRYVINTLIDESITSSQLEGAATTRAVAKEMLRTGRPPRDKSERMILNNFLTMRRIRDLQHEPLTPERVFELHRRVTDGTLDKADAAGRFRRDDENIRVVDDIDGTEFHMPPAAAELPARLEAMCAFANGTAPDYFVHPVIRGIILHFWLAYDHPFYDGNGRTARALFYWSMLRHEYQLFEFISISEILLRAPVRYAEAFLHTETDDNDLTYFILHQAEVIREAVKSLRSYLERKKAELHGASECLRGVQDLNHRQQALLLHALREPGTVYLVGAHQLSHGVSNQTARDDLFDLVERGLMTAAKVGRAYHFKTPGDLNDKLGKLANTAAPPPDSDPTLPLKLPYRTAHD
jgi:Fic family protein